MLEGRDPNACNRLIDERIQSRGDNQGEDIFVRTTGDDVQLIYRTQVIGLASPIESLAEAAAAITYADEHRDFDCDANNAREEADGWVFKQTVSGCEVVIGRRG